MAKEQTKPKGKIGRNDRYPSDYGVRDHDQKSTRTAAGFPAAEDKGAKVKARVTGGRELVPGATE
jgi:hypothetical protein